MHQVKNHPNRDALIADLHNSHPYNPFSEASKQMVNLGNVQCFESCEISSKSHCSYYVKYWTEGIVHLIPTEYTRRLTKEKFDAPTIPDFLTKREHAMVLATGKL